MTTSRPRPCCPWVSASPSSETSRSRSRSVADSECFPFAGDPRPGDIVVVGATEIESEDRSGVSLASAVELLSAAQSVIPALAEARIVHLETNLRPALPDNRPRIVHEPGLLRINGLYRHGWLLAPALVEDALVATGL